MGRFRVGKNGTGFCYGRVDSCSFVPYCEQVEICETCGLGRSLSTGRAAELQDYVQHNSADRESKTAHLLWVFKRYLQAAEPGALLDIGCADGTLLDIAAAEGWRATGLDSYQQSNCRHPIVIGRFLQHDFDERFDVLTMIHSFEHMDDPRATLRKCRSLLNNDGRLLVVVPNFGGWWARVMGQDWQWLNVHDHPYHYTEAALIRLVEQTGFRVEICRTSSRFAPSLLEMALSAKRVFDWPGLRIWPIRSALYRLSSHLGIVCNPIGDFLKQGAELHILARPL